MMKWEIYTEDFEFRGKFAEASEQDIIDLYEQQSYIAPHLEEQYDTEAEARTAWEHWKNYGMMRQERSFAGTYLLRGRLAYLEQNEYDVDEDGEEEFFQSHGWLCCSIEPYKAAEEQAEEE